MEKRVPVRSPAFRRHVSPAMISVPTEVTGLRTAGQGRMSGPAGGTISASREPPEGGTIDFFDLRILSFHAFQWHDNGFPVVEQPDQINPGFRDDHLADIL